MAVHEPESCEAAMLPRVARRLSDADAVGRSEVQDARSIASAAYRRAPAEIDRLARDPSIPVFVEGESGTGKTMIARRIHELSPRASRPFERVVLSAVDDSLAGSELFGHIVGAFIDARTSRAGAFSLANSGTLVLDEIGKASRVVQQKLLHAIEYGEVRPLGSDRTLRVDASRRGDERVPSGGSNGRAFPP
jgi:transcriptional regulator with GAF, ATPase, and Fis domain